MLLDAPFYQDPVACLICLISVVVSDQVVRRDLSGVLHFSYSFLVARRSERMDVAHIGLRSRASLGSFGTQWGLGMSLQPVRWRTITPSPV